MIDTTEGLDGHDRVGPRRIHQVLRPQLRGKIQLGLLDGQGDDRAAHDAGVLDGQVAEATAYSAKAPSME